MAQVLGGRPNYLRMSTTAYSFDQLLERVEMQLAGFDPALRKDQILAGFIGMIIECGKGNLPAEKAAPNAADLLAGVLPGLQHEIAAEAAALFRPDGTGQTDPGSVGVERAVREAREYGLMIALLPSPAREIFVTAWDKK